MDAPTDCGMMICDVKERGIDITYLRAASPWDSFYKRFVPCVVTTLSGLQFRDMRLL